MSNMEIDRVLAQIRSISHAGRADTTDTTGRAGLGGLRHAADLREHTIYFHLAHDTNLRLTSGGRDVDTRIADAGELVAQGARADAQLLRHLAA